MNVKCVEMFSERKNRFGTITKRSLNQHYVFVEHAITKRPILAGYVGTSAFIPLPDTDAELCEEITKACEAELGRKLDCAEKQPSLSEALAMNEEDE